MYQDAVLFFTYNKEHIQNTEGVWCIYIILRSVINILTPPPPPPPPPKKKKSVEYPCKYTKQQMSNSMFWQSALTKESLLYITLFLCTLGPYKCDETLFYFSLTKRGYICTNDKNDVIITLRTSQHYVLWQEYCFRLLADFLLHHDQERLLHYYC